MHKSKHLWRNRIFCISVPFLSCYLRQKCLECGFCANKGCWADSWTWRGQEREKSPWWAPRSAAPHLAAADPAWRVGSSLGACTHICRSAPLPTAQSLPCPHMKGKPFLTRHFFWVPLLSSPASKAARWCKGCASDWIKISSCAV